MKVIEGRENKRNSGLEAPFLGNSECSFHAACKTIIKHTTKTLQRSNNK